MRISLHENTLEKYITILTRNLRSYHGKAYRAYRKAANEIDELYETGNCDFNGIRDILLANGLTDSPNSYLTEDYLTQEELLQEKSLFGSMEGQVKKTLKAIDKQIKEFESVIPTIKAESEKLTNSIGGEEAFSKAIAAYSSDALKKVVQAKASIELAAGLATVEEELKHAREILTDKDYLAFCKKVDDNTKLFGGSKGKLTAKDKDGKEIDVTSKTAGKVVDKSKESNLNKKDTNNADEAKNESILNEEDVTEGLEDFKKKSEELGQALANAGQITEMLQNDPEMKKVAQAANIKFNSVLGVLAITGGVCKLLGNVVPGLGLIGTALASGSVLARTGKSVTKTIQNPNMSISQKILTIAPSVAASVFATVGLGNAAKALTGASAVGAGIAAGLETGSGDSDTGSNSVDTNAEDTSTDDADTNVDTSTDDDTSSNDTEEETSEDDTDEEELGEPTIENSIAAQAKAKVGDILQRDDGTKVKLNQGDIDWAKKIVKEEPDMAEATVDETSDIDNPVFDTDEHPESSEVEDTDSDTDANEKPVEDTSNEEENSEEDSNDSEDSEESNSEPDEDSEEELVIGGVKFQDIVKTASKDKEEYYKLEDGSIVTRRGPGIIIVDPNGKDYKMFDLNGKLICDNGKNLATGNTANWVRAQIHNVKDDMNAGIYDADNSNVVNFDSESTESNANDTANDDTSTESDSSAEETTPEETDKDELTDKEDIKDAQAEIEDTDTDTSIDVRSGNAFEGSDADRAAYFKAYEKGYGQYSNPMRLSGAHEGERLITLEDDAGTVYYCKYKDGDSIDPKSIQVFLADGRKLIDGGVIKKNDDFFKGVNKGAFWSSIKSSVNDASTRYTI